VLGAERSVPVKKTWSWKEERGSKVAKVLAGGSWKLGKILKVGRYNETYARGCPRSLSINTQC